MLNLKEFLIIESVTPTNKNLTNDSCLPHNDDLFLCNNEHS